MGARGPGEGLSREVAFELRTEGGEGAGVPRVEFR